MREPTETTERIADCRVCSGGTVMRLTVSTPYSRHDARLINAVYIYCDDCGVQYFKDPKPIEETPR